DFREGRSASWLRANETHWVPEEIQGGFEGGPRMEVSRSVWPQRPWSPLGYQVVEVADEKVPQTEGDPQPSGPSRRRESSPPPRLPWALPGYRVVETAEEPSPGPTPRSSPGAGAAKGSPPRKVRPLVRWGAVAGCGSFLLAAAIALVPLR